MAVIQIIKPERQKCPYCGCIGWIQYRTVHQFDQDVRYYKCRGCGKRYKTVEAKEPEKTFTKPEQKRGGG